MAARKIDEMGEDVPDYALSALRIAGRATDLGIEIEKTRIHQLRKIRQLSNKDFGALEAIQEYLKTIL